ncbi:MAG: hypothetical protein IT348_10360 [Candidatus Eisenbacteria bacterium]|nr:hypothetical protein [Candidatus Eisenbacteria bacterium]
MEIEFIDLVILGVLPPSHLVTAGELRKAIKRTIDVDEAYEPAAYDNKVSWDPTVLDKSEPAEMRPTIDAKHLRLIKELTTRDLSHRLKRLEELGMVQRVGPDGTVLGKDADGKDVPPPPQERKMLRWTTTLRVRSSVANRAERLLEELRRLRRGARRGTITG